MCYAYDDDVKLTKQWWDAVLDGRVYEVNVQDTGYRGVNAFRSAVYQQADARFLLAATHKSSAVTLVVQAWGAPGLPANMPRLEGVPAQLAPVPALRPPARLAPQEQPPTMTVEPELTEADTEALLGPCSCGQSPQCLPDCTRLS